MPTQSGSIDMKSTNQVKLTAEGWYSTLESDVQTNYATKSELSVTANTISIAVSEVNDKVDGINVTNLLTIGDVWEHGSWNTSTGAHTNTTTRIRNTSGGNYIPIEPGKTYTLSRHTQVSQEYVAVLFAYDDNGAFVAADSVTATIYNYPYTYTPTTATRLEVGISHPMNDSITVAEAKAAMFKFEEGSVPTGWSQAPSDIDYDIDDASTKATGYVTDFGSNGIKVHPLGNDDDYVTIDASGLEVFDGTVSVAKFGATSRVGTASGQRVAVTENTVSIYDVNNALALKTNTSGVTLYRAGSQRAALTANGLDIYGSDGTTSIASFGSTSRVGTASGARVVTTTNGIDIYNASNQKKASYGTTQYIYGGNGAAPYLMADGNGVYLYQNADNHANVTSSGLTVYQGGNAVASFGSTARIGQSSKHNIYLGANAINIYDANGALGQQIAATGNTIYTAGTKRALFNATGLMLYATNGSTVSAEFKDSEVNLGKNSDSAVINMCNGNCKISYTANDGVDISGLASKYGVTIESAPSGSYDSGDTRASLMLTGRTVSLDHRNKTGNYSTLFQSSGHLASGYGFNLQQGTSSKSVLMTGVFGLLGALSPGDDYHFIPIAGDKYLFFKQVNQTFDITTSFGSVYYTTISNQGATVFTTANGKGPIYSLQISISASTGLIWAMPMLDSGRRKFGYRVISATPVTGRACQVLIMGICGHANE